MEYIGRIDDEAKINGHRVDLTGIVGALKRIPKIRDASVLILQNPNNTSCELIAYVVTDLPYTAKNVSQIQESLSHQLPNYMIPHLVQVKLIKENSLHFHILVHRPQQVT